MAQPWPEASDNSQVRSDPARPTIGILSMGQMGAAISSLLSVHGYKTVTTVTGRSEATRVRAENANALMTDEIGFVRESDCILSIVPPRDATTTAERVIDAFNSPNLNRATRPLCYADLNAISPTTTARIAEMFQTTSITYIDGGIIGGPPKLQPSSTWTKPSIVVSGSTRLRDTLNNGAHLEAILNMQHLSPNIGTASRLKMCFASLTKGLTAIAIQSFTTAERLGVLEGLQSHLQAYSPKTGEMAAKGIVGMQTKAYRWIDEMREIATTFETDSAFSRSLFEGAAETYEFVDGDTELGNEQAEDVGGVVKKLSQGVEKKKKDAVQRRNSIG